MWATFVDTEFWILALTAVCIAFFLVRMLLFVIVEPAYALLFNRPLYVHIYLVTRKLALRHQVKLHRDNLFYSRLSPRRKSYFDHRIRKFISRYTFKGRDGLIVTEEMKIAIAASHIMLTFGMRNYLPATFKTIVLYPDSYYSSFSEDHHKGDFNPMAKAVAFSWKHFEEGNTVGNDNLNLGIHEFAHVMHLSGRNTRDTSSAIFSDMYVEILEGLRRPGALERVRDAGYFREYAFTNEYEFIAVILEHFFETPEEFKEHFPALYRKVAKMINYREQNFVTSA